MEGEINERKKIKKKSNETKGGSLKRLIKLMTDEEEKSKGKR